MSNQGIAAQEASWVTTHLEGRSDECREPYGKLSRLHPALYVVRECQWRGVKSNFLKLTRVRKSRIARTVSTGSTRKLASIA